MGVREFFKNLPSLWRSNEAPEFKGVFDAQHLGVLGLSPYPTFDTNKLFVWHRRSEIAYACINKISEAAQDPDLVVQRRKDRTSPWETDYGHKLRRLLMRPNPGMPGQPAMTMAEFFGIWLASEAICGEFFAEIERNDHGAPVALWPLDPTKLACQRDGSYIWRDGGVEVALQPKDVFVSRLRDPQNPNAPLAPTAVALGRIQADAMKTAFVRAFFENSGVPSHIIKIKGRILKEQEALEIGKRWSRRFGFAGERQGTPPVFDENADVVKIGAGLNELDTTATQNADAAAICGVYGVPPLLISSLLGLMFVNQRASAIESQREFWANKMSPTFKRLRTTLQWSLLLEFEPEESVFSESVRCFWDMSSVVALQESMSERSIRGREDFRVGGLTLNEFRGVLGMAPIASGDYYLRPVNRVPVDDVVLAAQLDAAAQATADAISLELGGTRSEETAKSKRQRKDGRRWRYRAESDGSTCAACSAADGETADDREDLTPVPNPNCGDGFGSCRCIHEQID